VAIRPNIFGGDPPYGLRGLDHAASGHEAADAPGIERFGEAFDYSTGTGSFEIWIPIKA